MPHTTLSTNLKLKSKTLCPNLANTPFRSERKRKNVFKKKNSRWWANRKPYHHHNITIIIWKERRNKLKK
jgi:hypothetical protein